MASMDYISLISIKYLYNFARIGISLHKLNFNYNLNCMKVLWEEPSSLIYTELEEHKNNRFVKRVLYN